MIRSYIRRLELYAESCGARLTRTALPEFIDGRLCHGLITLRAGLTPEQELQALVHELAHWLAHSDGREALHPTVCEYEAEAVELLVLWQLGLAQPLDCPTDDLLPASVARVNWAGSRICDALGLRPQLSLQAQAPIDIEAAAGEEVVLKYEQHGVRDLFGTPEPL